jgi:hypothetical protein
VLAYYVLYGVKIFYGSGPGPNVIKLFFRELRIFELS